MSVVIDLDKKDSRPIKAIRRLEVPFPADLGAVTQRLMHSAHPDFPFLFCVRLELSFPQPEQNDLDVRLITGKTGIIAHYAEAK